MWSYKNKNSNHNFKWNCDWKTSESVSQRFSEFLAFYQWLNSLSFLENDAWVRAYVCSISKSSRLNCIFNIYVACVHYAAIKSQKLQSCYPLIPTRYLNSIHFTTENCMQPAGTWSHGLMSHCVNVSWCHPIIVFANPEALVLADTNL